MLLVQPTTVRHFADPGCPWAYSASPALATLRWRYGAQLDWKLTLIGLTERAQQYVDRGYTPQRQARGHRNFRQYGMPFQTQPKHHVAATSRACRAVVAARMEDPALGDAAFRALQLMQFTTPLVLDEDGDLATGLRRVPGLDALAIVARIDDPDVVEAYEADRALARTAAGSPTEFQGKSAATDGPVRYTAPSLVFERSDTRVEAGGFQPIEAYDVVLANFDTSLERRAPAEDPLEVLEEAPNGLVTAEVAEIMRPGLFPADRGAAEDALIDAAARGEVVRVPVGDDAVWLAAGCPRVARRALRARVRQVRADELHGRRQRRHAAGRRVVDRAQRVADAAHALARHARVVAAGLELDGDVDDAARVGDEVRRPQHALAREEVGHRLVGELVVGRPGDDRRLQLRHRLVVQDGPERAGCQDVDRGDQRLVRREPARAQARGLVALALVDVGDQQLGPAAGQQPREAQADGPEPDDGRAATLQRRAPEGALDRGQDRGLDAERGVGTG